MTVDDETINKILVGDFTWTRVKRYEMNESVPWEDRYHRLEAHHLRETNVLGQMLTELAQRLRDTPVESDGKRWQITTPGYEYNPNGADFYPDAHEEYEGTLGELRAYIMRKETLYQRNRILRERAPDWFADRHRIAPPERLTRAEWNALNVVIGTLDDAPCDVWCRGVVEIRDLPEGFLTGALNDARAQAQMDAAAKVEIAKLAVQADIREAAGAKEKADRELLAKLKTQYPDG